MAETEKRNFLLLITVLIFAMNYLPAQTITFTSGIFKKLPDAMVTAQTATVPYQMTSKVMCAHVCHMSNSCDGFQFDATVDCTLYEGVTAIRKNVGATNLYLKDVDDLIRANGYVRNPDNTKWVKAVKQRKNWNEALTECQSLFPNAMMFVPKSTSDVQLIHDLYLTVTPYGKKFWIGISDKDDETHSSLGTWEWIDGTKVTLATLYDLDMSNPDDSNDKDGVYVKFEENNGVWTGILKFEKMGTKLDGYFCQLEIPYI